MVTPDTVPAKVWAPSTKPPLATTVAGMCSNWENELAESAEMLWGFFSYFS
jgi:hypothetical protein